MSDVNINWGKALPGRTAKKTKDAVNAKLHALGISSARAIKRNKNAAFQALKSLGQGKHLTKLQQYAEEQEVAIQVPSIENATEPEKEQQTESQPEDKS